MAKVDIAKSLDLRLNHNLSHRQIAKMQGVSKSAIHKRLQAFLPTEATEIYRANKADIFSEAQLKVIINMDSKRLKSASLNNLAYSLQNLYNCERLERGQSTHNVAYNVITEQLKKIDEEEADLRRQLIELGVEDLPAGKQNSNTITKDGDTE